jgi:hypothetical protein
MGVRLVGWETFFGVRSYGDSQFYASTGSISINRPIVGMIPDAITGGY